MKRKCFKVCKTTIPHLIKAGDKVNFSSLFGNNVFVYDKDYNKVKAKIAQPSVSFDRDWAGNPVIQIKGTIDHYPRIEGIQRNAMLEVEIS